MKIILRTYDFIKSWLYYPKMKRYLKERIGVDTHLTRFRYALWHCKAGLLSDTGIENINPTLKDVADGWQSGYRRKPLEE